MSGATFAERRDNGFSSSGVENLKLPKLAYLCSMYPAISHTFVLREVNALRDMGFEITTFSIRRAGPEQLLADADHVAHRSTFAIIPPRWRDLVGAHLELAQLSPRAYLTNVGLALRLAPAGLRQRTWASFYFAEAVVLWSRCRREGIRHIHVHLANVAADVAMLAAAIGTATERDRPWSWSFTMHGPTEFAEVGQFKLAEKLKRARFVVCISDYARSQLMTLSDPAVWDRLRVIHVGIPIQQFTRVPGKQSAGDRPRILFIGRQVPEKGQAVLLQATARLAHRGHLVDVVLAGEGAARRDFERLAEDLGISSQVSFPGAVGQEEIHRMYAEASIFCLPSFAEGVPGVLMEAMAMELPVVSTRITGVPELIDHERSGLLVPPGRVDALADALERLLLDPELCRKMGARGREKVLREFNTDGAAAALHELFVEQLGTRTSAGTGAPNCI